jgi:predicted transcriptional regulator
VPESVIRLDEWLAELERASASSATGPDGYTAEEIAERMGIGHRAVMYHVKEWVRERRMEFVGLRKVVNVTGRISRIPVYRPVADK